jgi:uncharacterized protein
MTEPSTARGRWVRQATGWLLLVAGVAGCVLPVAPGIPFLLAGLALLAKDYAWARRAIRKMKRWLVQARKKIRARRERKMAKEREKAVSGV